MSSKVQWLLSILLVLCGWQLYESHRREQQLETQVVQLSQRVIELEAQLAAMDTAVQSLRSESLPEMLRRANGALQGAWQDLLDNLERELDESLQQGPETNPGDRQDDQYPSIPEAEVLKRT